MRHNGECVPAAVFAPVSICVIVLILKPVTYTSKNNLIYVYGDGLFHINYFDSDNSLFLHYMAMQFYVLDDEMCKATIPVINERCVTSQWRQVGNLA